MFNRFSARSREREQRALLHAIIRRFLGDDDVVHMALAQSSSSDANEAALLLQFLERARAYVTHPASQPADKLIGHSAQRPFVANAPFHAFTHRLAAFLAL